MRPVGYAGRLHLFLVDGVRMSRLLIVLITMFAIPGVVLANTPTPTTTPTPTATAVGQTYIDTVNLYDTDWTSQYDPSMSHNDIMRSLGVDGSYQSGVYGQSLPFNDVLNVSLGADRSPDNPVTRSLSYITCSDRNGSVAGAYTRMAGVQAVAQWNWTQYTECGGYRGPACAAQLQDMGTYTYYYSDLGRGSWFTIPHLSFFGAPIGAPAPPSGVYSTVPQWTAKLFFENGSVREVETGAIPTWRPDQQAPGQPYINWGNIWNPREIGRTFETDTAGRRFYITALQNNQVANFAVQFRMPKRYIDTFKPRLSVCAVRPNEYNPSFAATAQAQQTNVAATRTVVAGNIIVPPAPTTAVSALQWDDQIKALWQGQSYYAQCRPVNNIDRYDHCWFDFYGASGSTPTYIVSGLYVEVFSYDPATRQVGGLIAFANFTGTRGLFNKLTFEQIKTWYQSQNNRRWDPYRTIVQISCARFNGNTCPPAYNNGQIDMYKEPGHHLPTGRSSPTYLILSPGQFKNNFRATATAYKSQRTPTRTVQVMTAIPTFTPRPTNVWPTLPPAPPTINATTQTGATQTAIVRQRQTATAAAGVTYATQTAVAVAIAQATAAQATAYTQQTAQRATATAAIAQTQVVELAITSAAQATMTAVAQIVGTMAATQQAGVNRTATVQMLIDDGDAVFRGSFGEQIEQAKDVSEVGPGGVFSVLVDAATAFDRGLQSSPCNGLPASIAGRSTTSGDYQITDDLAASLCTIRQWLDAQTNVIPLIRQILSVVIVLLIVIMIMRIIRGSSSK